MTKLQSAHEYYLESHTFGTIKRDTEAWWTIRYKDARIRCKTFRNLTQTSSGTQTWYKIWHNNTNEMTWLWPRRACRKLNRNPNGIERDGMITRCAPMTAQFLATISDSTKLNLFMDSCDPSDREIGGFTILYAALVSLQNSSFSNSRSISQSWCRNLLNLILHPHAPQHKCRSSGSAQASQTHVMNFIMPDWLRALSLTPCALARLSRPGFGARDMADGGHLLRLAGPSSVSSGLSNIMAIILRRTFPLPRRKVFVLQNPPRGTGSKVPMFSWQEVVSSSLPSCRISRSLFGQFFRKNPVRESHVRNRILWYKK